MTKLSIDAFLTKLRALGVTLSVQGERSRFDAPPGTVTPGLRSEVAAHKAELIKHLKEAPLNSQPVKQSIPRVARDGILPLSFAQQRLWFMGQMEGASETYHMPLALRLMGALDSSALRRALDRILARHEALRTTFSLRDGEPVQRIGCIEDGHFLLIDHDLRHHPDAKAELDRLIELETGTSFDFVNGPMIRGRLIALSDTEHVLLITMHHIASDGWSVGLLCNELSVLYAAFLRDQEDPLPEFSIQYADYSVWHRQWVKSDLVKEQADYWKTALAGTPALLELPTDHSRPAVQDYNGAYAELVLDEQLTAGLRDFSKRHRVTLFMTLTAAWATLLSRLSGQQDVVIGTPVANRGQKEVEGLIGFFANTLALRFDLSGSPTVRQLLEQTRARLLDALQHQDCPFEHVVDLTHPARNLAYTPLFQVMLGWQEFAQERVELPGLETRPLHLPHRKAKFDLTILLQAEGDTITGFVEYATSLFEQGTINRYLRYFRTLLQGMMAGDTVAVDRLPMLPEAERHQILVDWNNTAVEFPSDACVHQLFEEQAARVPDAVAVVFEDKSLTYATLNRRANQLAHHLRKLGVKPDTRVAICAHRSFEMVVAFLAVLKAGGAYVPLDPAYPVDRLHFMLEDSEPHALLTQAHLVGLFTGLSEKLPILDLSSASAEWRDLPNSNPDRYYAGLNSSHLAYVIYTSGSSGSPKGVAMPHKALVNLLCWQNSQPDFSRSERVLQFAALGFDVAFQETASTLCSGRTLVLTGEAYRLNPASLLNLVHEKGIHQVFLPYALLSLLADGAGEIKGVFEECESGPPAPQEIITAGEQLRINPNIIKLFQKVPRCRLQNQYGPTETHVITSFRLPLDTSQWPNLPPIGRPIANTRIYLLDIHGQPVPQGVVGELYAGGICVARGYLNRPDLTAERFLPDPFSSEPGARMYRTGDLCRWLPDGNIEYLGRNDFQVKIRGFRIELGEIEARLARYPGVGETVVIAREDIPGNKRLVAYYTTPGNTESKHDAVSSEQFRSHLLASLPEYMVPAAYVHMQSLPLTPNGKLDRKALPVPEIDSYSTHGFERPQGETEIKLAAIWADLLKLDRVGRRENFFGLGGDSITSVRVVSRAEREGIKLSVTAMIANQTIAELASAVEAANITLVKRGIPRSAVMSQSSERQDLEDREEIEI